MIGILTSHENKVYSFDKDSEPTIQIPVLYNTGPRTEDIFHEFHNLNPV